jgi:hypothetical protein
MISRVSVIGTGHGDAPWWGAGGWVEPASSASGVVSTGTSGTGTRDALDAILIP